MLICLGFHFWRIFTQVFWIYFSLILWNLPSKFWVSQKEWNAYHQCYIFTFRFFRVLWFIRRDFLNWNGYYRCLALRRVITFHKVTYIYWNFIFYYFIFSEKAILKTNPKFQFRCSKNAKAVQRQKLIWYMYFINHLPNLETCNFISFEHLEIKVEKIQIKIVWSYGHSRPAGRMRNLEHRRQSRKTLMLREWISCWRWNFLLN
jgi:hypothetical protein